jgi:hypothetical protein
MNRVSSALRTFQASVLVSAIFGFCGCSGTATPAPRAQLDPNQAAQAALQLYDTNHDGILDAKELEKSPPLMDLLKNLKEKSAGHPDSLTSDDIAGRIQVLKVAAITILPGATTVFLDGKPLEGATVTYEPEPFLGASYRRHEGQTNAFGGTALDSEPERKDLQGIYVGLYRIRISKMVNGKETIPARYNAETTLGRELASDVPACRKPYEIRLKSQ